MKKILLCVSMLVSIGMIMSAPRITEGDLTSDDVAHGEDHLSQMSADEIRKESNLMDYPTMRKMEFYLTTLINNLNTKIKSSKAKADIDRFTEERDKYEYLIHEFYRGRFDQVITELKQVIEDNGGNPQRILSGGILGPLLAMGPDIFKMGRTKYSADTPEFVQKALERPKDLQPAIRFAPIVTRIMEEEVLRDDRFKESKPGSLKMLYQNIATELINKNEREIPQGQNIVLNDCVDILQGLLNDVKEAIKEKVHKTNIEKTINDLEGIRRKIAPGN
jgi:hypothetical protein